jgi:Domain of unknown function (DUF892)
MLNRAAARGSSGIVMSGWRPLIKGYFTALRLRESFERHLAETRNHVRRIERVFEMHGVERSTVHCPAIDGIIKEADEIAGEVDDKQVLVNFIPLAQRRESGDAPSHGGYAKTYLVDGHWALQITHLS